MSKFDLMKQLMSTFVGNGFHLVIKDHENCFFVHTIEIIQKIDDSCPVKEIPVGDYFFRLLVRDKKEREASILCNWSEHLLQNLLDQHVYAKGAGAKEIVMSKDSSNGSDHWLLTWGNGSKSKVSKGSERTGPLAYIC